jgi:hypothetical protein
MPRPNIFGSLSPSNTTVNLPPNHNVHNSLHLGAIATALVFSGGVFVGFTAEQPQFITADVTKEVQPDSRYDILFESMVEQPLPQFGMVFANISSGKWHIVKVVNGELLGKQYSFSLPATGRSVEFSNVPVKVETVGTNFGVYSWKKGENDPQTNLPKIEVTVNNNKIAHNVSFLEDGYNTSGNTGKETYIINKNDPSTRIGDKFIEGPGDYAEAICNGASGLIGKNPPEWCSYLGTIAKETAIQDSDVENSGRQAALESVRKCMPLVWQDESKMIQDSVKKIIGTQMQYSANTWDDLISVKFKSPQMPDYTKSTLDQLVKKGVLTKESLEQQGYTTDNSISVTCQADQNISDQQLSGSNNV